MKNHLTIITILIILLTINGCNGTKISGNNTTIPITNADTVIKEHINDRFYFISPPEGGIVQHKAYKLLLAFHGSGQSAISMKQMTELASVSDNYLVVYPQSKVEEWNEGCDCNKPNRLGIDDLAFVESVVSELSAKYNIINDELYAVGFSQGGLFVQNLMCNSNLEFKGLVSVASPMSVQLSQSCQIKQPTNYMMIHGTADQTLSYFGKKHDNFGLISSEAAIALLANQNGITTGKNIKNIGNVEYHIYQNDNQLNQLLAIKGGGHQWQFSHFNTSAQAISFFDSVSDKTLDQHSTLYRADQDSENNVHVRSMGLEHSGPAVILLSGFNKNYHSDSAWFSLLQPLIAKTHRVHVIERYGNGFSSDVEQPSYAAFAKTLDNTLAMLNEQKIILVSFASGNILAHLWQNLPDGKSQETLTGMVWIDPDILLPHSISLYQDWPVTWYRDGGNELLDYINQGKMTERTLVKLLDERTITENLIPAQYNELMDWSYHDVISQGRAKINRQIIRAKEIINYHDDLNLVSAYPISKTVPISVIDTDFERHDIDNAEANFVENLQLWQQEGSEWSQEISAQSNGYYIPLTNSDHLAVFQHPEVIVNAINQLINR